MRIITSILSFLVLASCSIDIPKEYSMLEGDVAIYPDYKDVYIPCNIAPLAFHMQIEADDYVTAISLGNRQIVVKGQNVVPDIDDWHELISDGGEVTIESYLKMDGAWYKVSPWKMTVMKDEIDNYLAYRLVHPGYILYSDLSINQRDLTSWDEKVIYDTRIASTDEKTQCVNCHSFHNYNGSEFQFHTRAAYGGTVIISDGRVNKVNLKTDSTLSAGVYPAWHPKENLIAYSINKTGQVFHTLDRNKIEVQDECSDMIIYDIETNTVHPVSVGTKEFECYPAWTPDGEWLYYSKADYNTSAPEGKVWDELRENFYKLKYNIVRRKFNSASRTFGEEEMVLKADTMTSRYYKESGLSATLPRFSPDGKYLVVTLGSFGVFHIWHRDADIYIIDTQTGEGRYMDGLNSRDVDSYHSWSSNGKWMAVSSRREDGSFTRPFFSYIDENGDARKPFVLPQKNPMHNKEFQRSYNIPEFTKTPVSVSPQEIASRVKRDALQAKFAR